MTISCIACTFGSNGSGKVLHVLLEFIRTNLYKARHYIRRILEMAFLACITAGGGVPLFVRSKGNIPQVINHVLFFSLHTRIGI